MSSRKNSFFEEIRMSREAAPDSSPGRKPWVFGFNGKTSPERAAELLPPFQGLNAPKQFSQGLRPGLESGAASRLILISSTSGGLNLRRHVFRLIGVNSIPPRSGDLKFKDRV